MYHKYFPVTKASPQRFKAKKHRAKFYFNNADMRPQLFRNPIALCYAIQFCKMHWSTYCCPANRRFLNTCGATVNVYTIAICQLYVWNASKLEAHLRSYWGPSLYCALHLANRAFLTYMSTCTWCKLKLNGDD